MRTTLRAVGKNPAAPNRYVGWLNTHPKYAKKPISMREHLRRIRNVVESARALGYVPERIPQDGALEKAEPVVSDQEEIRDDPLHTSRGERIMSWLRAQKPYSIDDVLWTLVWRYGLRVSAIRALDRDHVVFEPHEADDWPAQHEFYPHLHLRDRPELGGKEDEGLPLKNTNPVHGERLIPMNDEDAESIRGYVDRGTPTGATTSRKAWEEHGEPDKYGLFGLITSEHTARISKKTIRQRVHAITCPTAYTDTNCHCDGCAEYRAGNDGANPRPSQRGTHCTRTRSPHQCRHGAITNMLDDGKDHETIASVVGTSPKTIRDVYDRADKHDRFDRTAQGWLPE